MPANPQGEGTALLRLCSMHRAVGCSGQGLRVPAEHGLTLWPARSAESPQNLQPYDVPVYDFNTHQRSTETLRVLPADVVIIEGILVLHMEEIRDMLNMKIYVDTDDDVRLARRCGV